MNFPTITDNCRHLGQSSESMLKTIRLKTGTGCFQRQPRTSASCLSSTRLYNDILLVFLLCTVIAGCSIWVTSGSISTAMFIWRLPFVLCRKKKYYWMLQAFVEKYYHWVLQAYFITQLFCTCHACRHNWLLPFHTTFSDLELDWRSQGQQKINPFEFFFSHTFQPMRIIFDVVLQ